MVADCSRPVRWLPSPRIGPGHWRGRASAVALARRLVAAALLARDTAAVPFNRGSFHAAALSWTDGDTT
jgi:hypothetical protein